MAWPSLTSPYLSSPDPSFTGSHIARNAICWTFCRTRSPIVARFGTSNDTRLIANMNTQVTERKSTWVSCLGRLRIWNANLVLGYEINRITKVFSTPPLVKKKLWKHLRWIRPLNGRPRCHFSRFDRHLSRRILFDWKMNLDHVTHAAILLASSRRGGIESTDPRVSD